VNRFAAAAVGSRTAARPRTQADALADRDAAGRALGRVPAEQREAVVLHHVHGWSFAEIASRLGIGASAARTRAFRGLKKMREAGDG
jgi:RNA polymerase sigma-70 factor (ECF subfamily)